MKDPSSLQIRWRLKLEEYDFDVQHKPGNLNRNADALSRIIKDPLKPKLETVISDDIIPDNQLINFRHFPNLIFSKDDTFKTSPSLLKLNDTTKADTQTEKSNIFDTHVLTRSQQKQLDSSNSKAISNPSQISNTPDIEPEEINPNDKSEIICIVDPSKQEQVIKEFHLSTLSGHQGLHRTVKRLKKYYYFPQLIKKVDQFIKNCDYCQKNKCGKNPRIPMKITTTSKSPFEKVFMDIVGPLPLSYLSNRYLLTIQDDLTKYCFAIPIHNQEATTIAEAFLKNFVCIYGAPKSILTDQGTNFLSEVFKNCCKMLNIKKMNSTAFHPQTNGALERSHRTFTEYLRHFVDKYGMDWDIWSPFCVFTYNTTPHCSTGYMPYELVFGHRPNLPSSFNFEPEVNYNYDDLLCDFKYKLQNSYQIARHNIVRSKENSKRYYDTYSKNKTYANGDLVWLKNEQPTSKFSSRWLGPYKVNHIVSPENTAIQIGNRVKVVHNNRLKLKL